MSLKPALAVCAFLCGPLALSVPASAQYGPILPTNTPIPDIRNITAGPPVQARYNTVLPTLMLTPNIRDVVVIANNGCTQRQYYCRHLDDWYPEPELESPSYGWHFGIKPRRNRSNGNSSMQRYLPRQRFGARAPNGNFQHRSKFLLTLTFNN